MKRSNRREFLQGAAAGAVGLGLSSAMPMMAQAPAQEAPSTPSQAAGNPPRRKMVVRADDIGLSNVCNIGTFEAIEHGVVTTAAVMLCDPGTEDGLKRLRDYPWIAIDWHMHMWGGPVADPKTVPSLILHDGEFAGRFRTDLQTSQEVNFDEAVRELRAQLLRCEQILGRIPETSGAGNTTTPWGRAVRQVADENKMIYNFFGSFATPENYAKHVEDADKRGEEWAKGYPNVRQPATQADPKWRDRKIYSAAGTYAYIDLLTDSIGSVEKNYDPVKFYTEDRAGILKMPADYITWQAWHPGYVDYYVYRQGERPNRARAQQFVVGRTQDVHAMTSPVLKDWIKKNNIELINYHDALFGTNQYQNHLKAVGSDLAMI